MRIQKVADERRRKRSVARARPVFMYTVSEHGKLPPAYSAGNADDNR